MTFTVIAASAGSGKTYALTHEIARRVHEGVRPSQIIATTFTTKAASELSERVRRTLLDEGLVDEARAVSSALISTVNSVAGTILTEHALDAGLSPDIRILDEERQRLAFRTAIDQAAAAASVRHGALLARLEHDGDEEASSFFDRSVSWIRQVRELATAARTNGLSADDLREAAEASYAELAAEVLPPRADEDLRPRWAHLFSEGIAGLRADLEAGDVPARSVENVSAAVEGFGAFAEQLARPERVPWSQWARLADVTKVPAAKKPGAKVVPHFEALQDEVSGQLLANPALQEDIRALIALVLGTAAESLDAYARYKQELGLIDFVDQEVLTLDLVRHDERVRAALRSRFRLLAVDEFQDTSPVQLDLFLALADLVEDVVWVGDPKQAIYGFRGTDPALMGRVVAAIEEGGDRFGDAETRTLEHSWRSGRAILDLTGALFSRLFADMPRERVVLTLPPQRRATVPDGRIEAWLPRGKGASVAHHARVVAGGVADLLADPEVSPGEVAVLVRTGTHRTAVAEALAARGIPTTGAMAPPLATREGMIVRAGLAAALDATDTLALTELVTLLDDHGAHADWFAQLTGAVDREGRDAVLGAWRTDPALARLEVLRTSCIGLTPSEMVASVIDALDLPQRIKRWTAPETRRLTLDALRAAAAAYEDACRSEGRPVTLTGLRAHLEEKDLASDLADSPDAVWVGTMHGAKGLEWRHVVVMVPKEASRDATWGARILPTPELDLARPLAGRSLRWRPKVLAGFGPMKEAAQAGDFARARAAEALAEEGRLYYVALTRAREGLALSAIGDHHALAQLLGPGESELVAWGPDGVRIDGEPTALGVLVRELDVEEVAAPQPRRASTSPLSATDISLRPAVHADSALGARFRASGVASDGLRAEIVRVAVLGDPLVRGGGAGWDRVGEAVHGYLALPLAELDAAARLRAAERLRARWQVQRAVPAAVIVTAGERWCAYLAAEHAGAEVLTEQPIAGWNEEAQAMEGWIDTLLRSPDGSVVLVDHKTYPGEQPEEHIRKSYLGQFAAYARALEAATGRAPSRLLVHLPLRGEVWEVGPITPA